MLIKAAEWNADEQTHTNKAQLIFDKSAKKIQRRKVFSLTNCVGTLGQ